MFGEVRTGTAKGKLADEVMDRYEINGHQVQEDKIINLFVIKSDAEGPQAIVRYTSQDSEFEALSNFLKLYANTKFKRMGAPKTFTKGMI